MIVVRQMSKDASIQRYDDSFVPHLFFLKTEKEPFHNDSTYFQDSEQQHDGAIAMSAVPTILGASTVFSSAIRSLIYPSLAHLTCTLPTLDTQEFWFYLKEYSEIALYSDDQIDSFLLDFEQLDPALANFYDIFVSASSGGGLAP